MSVKKLKMLFLVNILAAALLLSLAWPALAGHLIQNTGKATITLESRGRAPETASGIARFRLKKRANGAHHLAITLKISGLPKRSDRVFDVWLIDDEDDTDMNVTTFNTNNAGRATVRINRNINNIAPYDRLVVTEEQRNRLSTERSDTVVLSGRLPH